MKKIKWINVMKLITMSITALVVIHDVYKLTIYSFITDKLYSWTWYGFITFILCLGISLLLYDDFLEQTKKVSTHTSQM